MKNFNDGDKVVSLNNVNFWNNPYHYKTFLNHFLQKVALSNDNYFTTNKRIRDLDNVSHKNMDALSVHYQVGGNCLSRQEPTYQVFNLATPSDKEYFLKSLEAVFKVADIKAKENQSKDIENLEKEIAQLQLRLERVKEGKHPSGPNYKSELEFNEECKQAILAKVQ